MRLVVIAAVLSALSAFAANAATMTLAGPSTATPGEVIVLTGTGSTGVGPVDVPGVSVLASIIYPDAFVNTNVPASSQTPIAADWTSGVLDCSQFRCRAFNQIAPIGSSPTLPVLTNFLISSTSFIIDPTTPIGTVLDFSWQSTPVSKWLFFGAVPIGSGSVVSVTVIPEPTTVALLAIGLLGLNRRSATSSYEAR